MLKILRKPACIGPADHGRRMSLDQFDRAIGREGYVYELSKGAIDVADVPEPRHTMQVQEIRNQLTAHRLANPGLIHLLAGSNESKILLAADQSERHPDLSVYLTPPPDVPDVWSLWVPAIVVEIVSRRSSRRDYEEKPGEYLEFGVGEYWVIDASRQQMAAMLRWRGQWKRKTIKPTQKHATRQLPGFTLDLKRVFAAAE